MRWYHGSTRRLKCLRPGNRITPWKELAAALAHKPTMLCPSDDNSVIHNGRQAGYLYQVRVDDELVDIVPYPYSDMDGEVEFINQRQMQVRLIAVLPAPTEEEADDMSEQLRRLMARQGASSMPDPDVPGKLPERGKT